MFPADDDDACFIWTVQGSFNYENMTDLLGDGIFAVDGDKWRQQRKIASYDFSTRALRDFSGAVFKRNAARLAGIVSGNAASGQPMEFQGLALRATMDSIFTIAFGLDLDTLGGSAEGSRFAAAFDDASEFTLLRYVNAFWKAQRFLGVGSEAALKKRVKVVDEFVYKRIRERAQELSDSKLATEDTVPVSVKPTRLSPAVSVYYLNELTRPSTTARAICRIRGKTCCPDSSTRPRTSPGRWTTST